MISVKNLGKTYKTKYGVRTAGLRDVSVDFPARGMVFVLGKSGSGKSTLLNLLGGIDVPTYGEIIVDGRSSAAFDARDFDSYRNAYVGFVFQEYNLIDDYTVGQNVALALELKGQAADRAKIDSVLARVGLAGEDGQTFYDRRTNELSGGQRQRVAIARALVKDPRLILADEPTGALDSKTGEQLYELLKILSAEKLVVVVTHDRKSAEKYGDRIIELADGEIVGDTGGGTAPAAPADAVAASTPKRGSLPFKRKLAMGVGGLKKKKVRLALSIFLSVVAFTVFGFTFSAGQADPRLTEVRTMYDNGMEMLLLDSNTNVEEKLSETSSYMHTLPFSDKQMAAIREFNGGKDPLVRTRFLSKLYDVLGVSREEIGNRHGNSTYYYAGLDDFADAIELNPETGCEDADLTPDDRFVNAGLCRLPRAENEIAITDFKASMFLDFGYREADGTVTEIAAPDDLIGKTLNGLTICGVYSTEIDRGELEKLDVPRDSDEYGGWYITGTVKSIISCVFVSEREHKDDPSKVVLKLSGNAAKDAAFLDSLEYDEGELEYRVENRSVFAGFLGNASLFEEYMSLPCMIAAAAFALFAALLTMNFLSASIDLKKRELGILRALGAGRSDVLAICLIESLTIALADYVLSLVVVAVLCAAFNAIYFISLMSLGVLTALTMLALCLGVTAAATALPVIRITKRRPVDVISGR